MDIHEMAGGWFAAIIISIIIFVRYFYLFCLPVARVRIMYKHLVYFTTSCRQEGISLNELGLQNVYLTDYQK